MPTPQYTPTAVSPARQIHAVLMPVGAAFLLGALITDIAYLATVSVEWETFSVWLITAGLVVAGFTGLALLIDLIVNRRGLRFSWTMFLCAVVAIGFSIVNAFVHSRDGYTAVAPSGLILSAVVAVLLIILGANGWSLFRPARIVQVA